MRKWDHAVEELLQELNPAQRQAVAIGDGPVLVLAGPGSGKTRVLTHRIAYLIGVRDLDPERILAVTFTNKAAREMKERLDALLGPGRAAALTVGTFHSICVRFLRRDIPALGRERDFVIYDSDDQLRLMKQVLRDLQLDEKKFAPRAMLSAISGAKNEYVSLQEFKRKAHTYFDEVTARCFERYQQRLRDANALDFDDLLVETVRLFEEHPEVLEKYQRRYGYVLADEYQDTNRVQYLFLKQLAAAHRNLFVVGDEDQSIYAFRGADIRNIRSFENDYPAAQVVLLEQNYRSTQAILDVAQSVINRSKSRTHKKRLWTQNDQGTLVSLQEGFDEDEEARLAAGEAARLINKDGMQPGEIAVMYRTNAQSRAVEDALLSLNLPYMIVGGIRFYERKEVKDALAYLRLIHNPLDSVSLGRVLNWPGRGIGPRTEEDLFRWAADQGWPAYTALQVLAAPETPEASIPISGRARAVLIRFHALLDELIQAGARHSLGDLIEMVYARVGFRDALLNEYGEQDGEERWANLSELRNVVNNYINLPRETQLATFLAEAALNSDVDQIREDRNVITCITLHQAKGLEYPVVFLLGLEEGLLPHARSIDSVESLEEERRLFYVGATRAKRRLYLLYSSRRANFGRTAAATPSRFLSDIPKELMHQHPRRPSAGTMQSSMFTGRTSFGTQLSNRAIPSGRNAAPPQPARPPRQASGTTQFTTGQKVRHAMYGDGVVVSSKPVDGDEEVTVAFPGQGVKRLLASFAGLKPVEE